MRVWALFFFTLLLAGCQGPKYGQYPPNVKAGVTPGGWPTTVPYDEGAVHALESQVQDLTADYTQLQSAYAQQQENVSELEQTVEAAQAVIDNLPRELEFNVLIDAPSEMTLKDTETVTVTIAFPGAITGSVHHDDATKHTMQAVSRYIKASLYGSNFEIVAEGDMVINLNVAGSANWIFKVTPTQAGEQALFATVVQVAGLNDSQALTNLKTDLFEVDVKVTDRDSILTLFGENLNGWIIAIITFLAGILAEVIRRKVLSGEKAPSNT